MSTRRDVIKAIPAASAAFAVAGNLILDESPARAQGAAPLKGHFHPKGKAPSKFTVEALRQARATLPFSDTRDFDENKRGLIAPMPDMKIMADAGHVAWDMERFKFIDQQEEFDSIHPSLHRISRLNNNYGLYEVVPGIYQIRGFDLSQISFVRGRTGWIVFDVAVSGEVARAAWQLFQKHRGEGLPITAVIYSHNHGDHWGGIRGIVNEADVRSGKIPIIAPRDFLRHTVEENVYAGNAMNRRLFFQYGLLLPAAPHGYVGQGLGQGVSAGAVGLIPPTRIVEWDIEEFEVVGVPMVFQNTPNTEAPSEMNTWIPGMKALWMAENVNATLHNIYTLRGAPVRDPLRWSKYINEALYRFGLQAKTIERLIDVFRPAQRIAHRGAAERVDVVQRGVDVLRHPQRLHARNPGVHLRWRFGVRRVLKHHGNADDLELLDVPLHDARRRDQPHGPGGNALSETLTDIAVRSGRQQQPILEEQPPVHRVAGVNILLDRVPQEIARRDDRNLARAHVRLVHDAADAAPVVAMIVRVDHGRDRQPLAPMLLEQLPGGAGHLARDRHVENDPPRSSADEADLRQVEAAYLINARDDLVEPVIVVQPRNPVQRGMNAVELFLLVDEFEPLHIPRDVAGIRHDLHVGHRGDETALVLVEVAGVGKWQSRTRLPQRLHCELRRRLALGVKVTLERRGSLRARRAFIQDQIPGDRERRTSCRYRLDDIAPGGHCFAPLFFA